MSDVWRVARLRARRVCQWSVVVVATRWFAAAVAWRARRQSRRGLAWRGVRVSVTDTRVGLARCLEGTWRRCGAWVDLSQQHEIYQNPSSFSVLNEYQVWVNEVVTAVRYSYSFLIFGTRCVREFLDDYRGFPG